MGWRIFLLVMALSAVANRAGADEKPFKPYEPVFAIVQVCSIWPVFRYLRLGFGSNA